MSSGRQLITTSTSAYMYPDLSRAEVCAVRGLACSARRWKMVKIRLRSSTRRTEARLSVNYDMTWQLHQNCTDIVGVSSARKSSFPRGKPNETFRYVRLGPSRSDEQLRFKLPNELLLTGEPRQVFG